MNDGPHLAPITQHERRLVALGDGALRVSRWWPPRGAVHEDHLADVLLLVISAELDLVPSGPVLRAPAAARKLQKGRGVEVRIDAGGRGVLEGDLARGAVIE